MIERTLFQEEHNIFRESVRRFMEREVVPHHAQWEKDGIVPRELWLKAGAEGLLCCTVPEAYGGLGLDYLFDVVVFEELWRVGASGPGFLNSYRSGRHLHPFLRHRGAKAKMAAEDGARRSDRFTRHD